MVKFEGYEFVDGGVCAGEGFTAAGVIAGIKAGNTTNETYYLYHITVFQSHFPILCFGNDFFVYLHGNPAFFIAFTG